MSISGKWYEEKLNRVSEYMVLEDCCFSGPSEKVIFKQKSQWSESEQVTIVIFKIEEPP